MAGKNITLLACRLDGRERGVGRVELDSCFGHVFHERTRSSVVYHLVST